MRDRKSLFQTGNTVFHSTISCTYAIDEEYGYRKTVYPNGETVIHKCSIDNLVGLIAPWNTPLVARKPEDWLPL